MIANGFPSSLPTHGRLSGCGCPEVSPFQSAASTKPMMAKAIAGLSCAAWASSTNPGIFVVASASLKHRIRKWCDKRAAVQGIFIDVRQQDCLHGKASSRLLATVMVESPRPMMHADPPRLEPGPLACAVAQPATILQPCPPGSAQGGSQAEWKSQKSLKLLIPLDGDTTP